jgi:hypothetical protein
VLEFAGRNKYIGRCTIHLQQLIVRHIEVNLGGELLGRRENGVERPLAHDVSDEVRHSVLDLWLSGWLRLFRLCQQFFASQVEKHIDGSERDIDLVDGESTRVR